MKLARYFYLLTLLFLDWVGITFAFPRRPKKDCIGVVRLDQIGDFILWFESARALRRYYQGQRIVLIANEIFAELARALPFWDEVVAINVRRYKTDFFYRFRVHGEIAGLGISTLLNPTYSRVILSDDSISRATRAPIRVGFAGNLSNQSAMAKRVSNRWYTRLISSDSAEKHELLRNEDFLLGLDNSYEMENEAIAFSPQLLVEKRAINRPYAVLFVGASWDARRWPSRNYVLISQEINRRFELDVVLCGSVSEISLGHEITAVLGQAWCHDFVGKTTLNELFPLVYNSRLVIANETSGAHIAAVLQVPSVCIVGGGHFGRFLPYPSGGSYRAPLAVFNKMDCFGCNWNCIYPKVDGKAIPCIEEVSPEQVMSVVNALISKRHGSQEFQ